VAVVKKETSQANQAACDRIPSWAYPLILDLGCCGPVALQIGAPGYGLPGAQGAGYDLAPEQTNVLIVAGRLSPVLAPTIERWYEQMTAPRWVVAYGMCAISGVLFNTLPTAEIVPVDLAVPGCPPPPSVLAQALASLSRRRPS
jgi:NADH-quinone oxidoreductase subunit B